MASAHLLAARLSNDYHGVVVRLRRATLRDVPSLEYWDTQPHVIAATGDDDHTDWRSEVVSDDPFQETLIAELDGRAIGVVQIIDPALEITHYWGDAEDHHRALDIWIGEAADLSRGYGTLMMTLALDRCFAPADVTAVLIDPLTTNTRAHRFYQRLGFVPVEERLFGNDRCLVHRMDRTTCVTDLGPKKAATMRLHEKGIDRK